GSADRPEGGDRENRHLRTRGTGLLVPVTTASPAGGVFSCSCRRRTLLAAHLSPLLSSTPAAARGYESSGDGCSSASQPRGPQQRGAAAAGAHVRRGTAAAGAHDRRGTAASGRDITGLSQWSRFQPGTGELLV